MDIRQIKLQDIPSDIVLEGKRSNLIFRDKANALYFGGFVEDMLISLICLVIYKNNNAAIKTNFTLKEHRRKGYFTALNKHILEYARSQGIICITLNCLKDSLNIHMRQGARLWKTTKNIFWLIYDKGF